MNLYIKDAVDFVRSRMDEMSFVPSEMVTGGEPDDRNLEETVERLLKEAIISVHTEAPASLMEGKKLTESAPLTVMTHSVDTNGVLTLNFTDALSIKAPDILRLVSFKAGDSDTLVTSVAFEDEAVARLQNNRYMRGTPDCPVMVRMATSSEYKPVYKYYTTTLKGDKEDGGLVLNPPTFVMEYFPVPEYSEKDGYFISAMLEIATLTYLTALVFQTYQQNETAKVFFDRAADALK